MGFMIFPATIHRNFKTFMNSPDESELELTISLEEVSKILKNKMLNLSPWFGKSSIFRSYPSLVCILVSELLLNTCDE